MGINLYNYEVRKELLIKENRIVDKLKTKDEIKLISLKIDYYNLYSYVVVQSTDPAAFPFPSKETKEEIISVENEKSNCLLFSNEKIMSYQIKSILRVYVTQSTIL
ncbi:hypothetical protein RCL_jg20975.t2 [Rhizophagus clarus]|uniref:Uncharacterized protein n=1 Tax=Rhizophagus clarus TaxID=94130 RepID=A0A8H3LKJ8_9GLOM|nr:hypothetical protein RCL_jg20975.t2 [Rhizophagus clarus]